MVLLELTMSPFDKGESLGPYVARVIDIIDKSGVPYKLTPMSTIMEGEYEPLMEVVQKCFKELQKDCQRISVSIKIDYRAGNESRLQSKIQRIKSLLGRSIQT